jgi:hypothetical protein
MADYSSNDTLDNKGEAAEGKPSSPLSLLFVSTSID